ncbi:hypothetical protein [Endothiovibrio diazotrophicus]
MNDSEIRVDALLHQVASHFRLGMQGAAAEGLVQLIDRLLMELQNAPLPPLRINELSALLGEVLAAQQRHDHLYLADLLQYRLAPLLPRG